MEVEFRDVTRDDLETVLEWRNHPLVRENSLNPEEISWEEHVSYWEDRFDDDGAYSFIVTANGEDAGLVRLDERDEGYEVHILVDPDMHGKGIGTATIEKTKQMAQEKGIQKLIATIKEGNPASEKIFRRNGFEPHQTEYHCDLD